MSRERVAAHWGDAAVTERLARIHWMSSPVVRAHLNRTVSGDPAVDWLSWAWGRFVRGRGLAVLVLGCGEGWLERSLARRPEVASIDACDVAAEAVEQARRRARDEGLDAIRYHVVDLNREPLPGGPWDVIVAHSVLHHVENLEGCFAELRRGLAEGGLLLLNEYAGPRRFQFTSAQMQVINGCLTRLPERLRLSAVTGGPYPRREVPSEAEMIATDPSEAVRSDELLPLTRDRFDVLEEVGCGGSVLHLLLYDVVQNFDPTEPRDGRLLALLCLLEAALVDAGELASDFVVAVARRSARPGPAARRRGRAPRALPPPFHAVGGAPSAAVAGGGTRRRIHSRPARDRRHGLELAPLRRAIHRRATGFAECDWVTLALADFAPAAAAGRRALVLEEPGPRAWLAARLGGVPAVEGVDVALPPVAGGSGWRLAAGGSPPAAAYGWVFSNGWLGRAGDRPALVGRLAAALAPGGVLIGDEYIGPEDGRAPGAAVVYARELLELLRPPGEPPAGRGERLRDRLVDLRNAAAERWGPRRKSVPELLGASFRPLAVRPTGGALLQRLLPAAEGLLDPADDRDAALLDLAAYLEELLAAAGVVADDYACFAAERTTG